MKEHCDEVSEVEGSELMNKDELLVNEDIEMEILVENVSNDNSLNSCIQHQKAAVTDIVSNDDTHPIRYRWGFPFAPHPLGKNKTYGEITCSYHSGL